MSTTTAIPAVQLLRGTSFFAVKVDGKYWMEIFDEGRSDVSQKGFTDNLFLAYRITPHEKKTIVQMNERPVTDFLRPDFPDWFPELRRGVFVEVKLIESIAEVVP